MLNKKARLFIGGLALSTTEESLHRYFESWGAVEAATVRHSDGSESSHGFITVIEPNISKTILASTHTIDGKVVLVERAKRPSATVRATTQSCKIFVGGLPPHAKEQALHDYFVQFGELTDVVIMMTAGQGKARQSRGFGFVTFASPNSVELVSRQRYHHIADRSVEVKRAIPAEMMQASADSISDVGERDNSATLPTANATSWSGGYLDASPGYVYPKTGGAYFDANSAYCTTAGAYVDTKSGYIHYQSETAGLEAYGPNAQYMYPAGWVPPGRAYGGYPHHAIPSGVPIYHGHAPLLYTAYEALPPSPTMLPVTYDGLPMMPVPMMGAHAMPAMGAHVPIM